MELNTRDLLIITMYQQGHSPTRIGTELGVSPATVRSRLKSPSVIAYQLDGEEAGDAMLNSLYYDGVLSIKRALNSDSNDVRLKATKLLFEAIGKMKKSDDNTSVQVNIDKVLQVLNRPATPEELRAMERYLPGGSFGTAPIEEAIPATFEDSE